MTKKQKLELTWIGKENRPKLEPRIPLEDQPKCDRTQRRLVSTDFRPEPLAHPVNLSTGKLVPPSWISRALIPTKSRELVLGVCHL